MSIIPSSGGDCKEQKQFPTTQNIESTGSEVPKWAEKKLKQLKDPSTKEELPLIEGIGLRLSDLDGTDGIDGQHTIADKNEKSGRVTNWNEKKQMTNQFAELMTAAHKKYDAIISEGQLHNVQHCADFLLFAVDANNKMRLRQANFCRHRLCPMCNWRRSLLIFGQTSEIARAIYDKHKKDGSGVRFIFVTLTIKNVPATSEALQAVIGKMNAAFKQLVGKGRNGVAASAGFRKNLLGYMKAFEITYNHRRKEFHPHIHALFEVRPEYFKDGYISTRGWSKLWTELLKVDYQVITYAEAVNNDRKAIAEVSKYPLKATDLIKIQRKKEAIDVLVELLNGVKNRRFVTYGGEMKQVRHDLKMQDVESDTADLTHADDKSDIDAIQLLLFRYHVKIGAYMC